MTQKRKYAVSLRRRSPATVLQRMGTLNQKPKKANARVKYMQGFDLFARFAFFAFFTFLFPMAAKDDERVFDK